LGFAEGQSGFLGECARATRQEGLLGSSKGFPCFWPWYISQSLSIICARSHAVGGIPFSAWDILLSLYRSWRGTGTIFDRCLVGGSVPSEICILLPTRQREEGVRQPHPPFLLRARYEIGDWGLRIEDCGLLIEGGEWRLETRRMGLDPIRSRQKPAAPRVGEK